MGQVRIDKFNMEFPDLGKHCSEASCKMLDFLPVKCDACNKIFCKDHMTYTRHACESAYKKNVQVPVCPLCNIPIPSARGDPPDIAVGAHIDTQCQSQPAKDRRKVFAYKCAAKGCRVKEMIQLVCIECTLNFCLKHRHAIDHKCVGKKTAVRNKAAAAAQSRQQQQSRNSSNTFQARHSSIQGNMSEDEALARAIQLSMQESADSNTPSRAANATAASTRSQARQLSEEEEERRRGSYSNCVIS